MRVSGHARGNGARRARAGAAALAALLGAAILPGEPGALAAAGPARAAPSRTGPAVPPGVIPVVLEPCLHGGHLTTCWAVRPTNDGAAELSFNIVIGRSRGQVTAYVSGLTRWGRWSAGGARTRCDPACPRLTVSFPPGLWTVLPGLALTLSRPLAARYPAGRFRYYSRLRIDDARHDRRETLAWSWRLDRYTRVSGGLPGLRL
jgi:hypothetical protein